MKNSYVLVIHSKGLLGQIYIKKIKNSLISVLEFFAILEALSHGWVFMRKKWGIQHQKFWAVKATFSHSLFMKDGANRRNNLKGRKKFLNYNILIVFVRKTMKKGHSSFSLSQQGLFSNFPHLKSVCLVQIEIRIC